MAAGCVPGFLLSWGCSGSEGPARESVPGPKEINETTWPVHTVADWFRGANALSPGDVDQDGFTDYVTNYEFDQRNVVPGECSTTHRAV